MKKLLSLALSSVLICSIMAFSGLTAFAADISLSGQNEPDEGTMNITYSVDPAYTVTIPEDAELNVSKTISAENVVLPTGEKLFVKITATSESDNTFALRTSDGATMNYQVYLESNVVGLTESVLTVNPDVSSTGSSSIQFKPVDSSIVYAGNYRGTLTFTVSTK